MENQEATYNSQNFVKNKKKVSRPPIGTYIMLIIYSLYILIPFYIIFISAVKTPQEAFEPVFTWWPDRKSVVRERVYVLV